MLIEKGSEMTSFEPCKKNQELDHFTIQKAGEAIFWHGEDAKFQRVNEAACRQLGYSESELLSLSVFDVNPELTQETFKEIWQKVLREGSLTLESQHVTRTGKVIPIEVNCNYIEFEGKGYCCSFVRDISRRKNLEKNLRFSDVTIEKAPDTIVWVDSAARIRRVNNIASQRLGYSTEEILSMTVFDINPEFTPEKWQEYWDSLKKNKVLTIESRHKRKDGSFFPVEILQNYVEFEGEEFSCGFVRDITERKRAEEKLTRLTIEKDRIENELRVASMIQNEFLPENPPQIPGIEFAAKTIPARFVGGDFFDFIPLPEQKLGLVLGDVAGKGVSAALHMARLMSDFRSFYQECSDPSKVLGSVNRLLSDRARRGMFATAVCILVDLNKKTLKIANAGHHPVLIFKAESRTIETFHSGGVPLGVISNFEYSFDEVSLASGDRVLIFSDGAVEATNERKELFGSKRLNDIFIQETNSPNILIETLLNRIKDFVGNEGPHDDITFMGFKIS
jgi:sigma-B regulation protein RsbU (phosphoserine phosphatase)